MKRSYKFSKGSSENFYSDPYEELRLNKRTKNIQRAREKEIQDSWNQLYDVEDDEEDYMMQ